VTYVRPAWEFTVDIYCFKLQRLQNEVLLTIGNLPWITLTRDLHVALEVPYLYDIVKKLCRQQTTVILNHENVNVRNIGQDEAQHRKYKRLNLVAVSHTIDQIF